MANTLGIKRGWHYDSANSRLDFYVNGTRVGGITTSAMTIPTGIELDMESGSTLTIAGTLTATDKIDSAHYAAASIDKEHLASEIYQELAVCLADGIYDNETITGAYRAWSACTLIRVIYHTDQAIGTSLGIDVVDGATDGNGSDVIDSCSDNLNGSDINDVTTPYALSAGDYLNVVVDDITASSTIRVTAILKVPLGAAT